jgi:predicted dienelactone hydrolase
MKKSIIFIYACLCMPITALAYDPKTVLFSHIATAEWTVKDQKRHRTIPLYVYFPVTETKQPVIMFSHGLGGSRYNNQYLGNHWAKRGYVTVFIQHLGSDQAVWKGKNAISSMIALKKAANSKNFFLRVKDIPVVIDQLAVWNQDISHPLYQRLDMDHIGMSGHSFGAVTTQAVSGQQFGQFNKILTDSRIKAAIALSPSSPKAGNSASAFGKVTLPWMLMTGTEDNPPIGNRDATSRREVYRSLPKGNKYELVLSGGEHYAFSDHALNKMQNPRNPQHHAIILSLSTAFWDSYLRGNEKAKDWLQGQAVYKVLSPKDLWQYK